MDQQALTMKHTLAFEAFDDELVEDDDEELLPGLSKDPDVKDRTRCVNGNHIYATYNRKGKNCNIAPTICDGCSYTLYK